MRKAVEAMKLLTRSVAPTGDNHSATVIFFHGSGDTGSNLLEWVRFLLGKDMIFPHIKVLYPTAPLQPYTPINGELSNVWFDRRAISIDVKESRKSLAKIYETVHELINDEVKAGIPVNRILVGGFSMGGSLALHTGYHMNTDLAGVFTCSSFLNRNSIVYESLQTLSKEQTVFPELRMFHGEKDTLVPIEWGRETCDELKRFGVDVTFTPLSNTLHELKKLELLEIYDWILKKLPPTELATSELQHKL